MIVTVPPVMIKNYNFAHVFTRRDRIMSRFVLGIISSLLLFEVFSGALRFYFSQMGLTEVIYIPKVICVLAVISKIASLKIRKFWPLIILALSFLIGLFNGATIANIGFSFFAYCPFIFGVLYGKYIEFNPKKFYYIIWTCFILSILGIYLDSTTDLAWKGFSYVIGDVEIQGNREWWSLGVDRIAGFSRLSASLAIMISIFAIYIHVFLRSTIIRLLLIAVTLYSIVLTTNKTAIIAYLIGLSIYFILRYHRKVRIIFYLIIAIGVILPLVGVFLQYSIDVSGLDSVAKAILFSFDDRLTNTWPNFHNIILKNNGLLWGTGLGTVGSAITTFPIKSLTIMGVSLGVADNTALYLYGIFGIFGFWLYTRFYWVLNSFLFSKLEYHRALCCIAVSICILSWTTDVFEAVVSSLFLGLIVSSSFHINQNI